MNQVDESSVQDRSGCLVSAPTGAAHLPRLDANHVRHLHTRISDPDLAQATIDDLRLEYPGTDFWMSYAPSYAPAHVPPVGIRLTATRSFLARSQGNQHPAHTEVTADAADRLYSMTSVDCQVSGDLTTTEVGAAAIRRAARVVNVWAAQGAAHLSMSNVGASHSKQARRQTKERKEARRIKRK